MAMMGGRGEILGQMAAPAGKGCRRACDRRILSTVALAVFFVSSIPQNVFANSCNQITYIEWKKNHTIRNNDGTREEEEIGRDLLGNRYTRKTTYDADGKKIRVEFTKSDGSGNVYKTVSSGPRGDTVTSIVYPDGREVPVPSNPTPDWLYHLLPYIEQENMYKPSFCPPNNGGGQRTGGATGKDSGGDKEGGGGGGGHH